METFGFANVLKIASDFGLVGFIIFLWWSDGKRILLILEQGKKDLAAVMERYQHDMMEQREMYRANASLCRDFASIATDLRDIVTLNIQSMTQLNDAVRGNQFCPMIRIREEKRLAPKYEPGPHNEAEK